MIKQIVSNVEQDNEDEDDDDNDMPDLEDVDDSDLSLYKHLKTNDINSFFSSSLSCSTLEIICFIIVFSFLIVNWNNIPFIFHVFLHQR
jgi:hypothetical protein